MTQQTLPPLIPRKVLFDHPDKTAPRVSPDGTQLSYLAALDGVLNVWVGPVRELSAMRPVTHDRGRGIHFYEWGYTNQHLFYIQDKDGDENWHVYCVDLTTNETRDLTPLAGVQARIERISYLHPNEILLSLNQRNPQFHDLYQVNFITGERQLVLENEGFARFITDLDYRVHFAMRGREDGGADWLRRTADRWESFAQVSMEDGMTTRLVSLDRQGAQLYLIDSRDRDTAALTAVTLATNAARLLAQDPRADVNDVLVHPTARHVQAVAFTYERKRWEILDPAIAADLAYLATVAQGEMEVLSRTIDDRFWIVTYGLDNGPERYYLYDRVAQQAEFLFTDRAALAQWPLAAMHSVVIKARDGLDLVSYYTLPPWCDRADGQPLAPLPMVLTVHGGPWWRDNWGYDPLHQLLANRGYAVLSVNFRGSTGFGKAFLNAGNQEWGRKMHDDLLDAVEWAIQAGIAERERVAILGGSYGGYATLVGLTFTPETFACGVDLVGPSNLNTLLQSVPEYWKPTVNMMYKRVGDPNTAEGQALLKERSPLTYVERMGRPLLIGQGANDPRVKQAESDQIVEAMQAKEIPVTYLLYPDEGHGFARPENVLSFFAVTEAFLAGHLEVERYEPIGDSFANASIEVRVGADAVPGLTAALSIVAK